MQWLQSLPQEIRAEIVKQNEIIAQLKSQNQSLEKQLAYTQQLYLKAEQTIRRNRSDNEKHDFVGID